MLNYVCDRSARHVTMDFIETGTICDEIRRSLTPPPPPREASPPIFVSHQRRENEVDESESEKDVLIQSLVAHLDSSYDYIKKLERNPKKVSLCAIFSLTLRNTSNGSNFNKVPC
jgi:hypothetical protein